MCAPPHEMPQRPSGFISRITLSSGKYCLRFGEISLNLWESKKGLMKKLVYNDSSTIFDIGER